MAARARGDRPWIAAPTPTEQRAGQATPSEVADMVPKVHFSGERRAEGYTRRS